MARVWKAAESAGGQEAARHADAAGDRNDLRGRGQPALAGVRRARAARRSERAAFGVVAEATAVARGAERPARIGQIVRSTLVRVRTVGLAADAGDAATRERITGMNRRRTCGRVPPETRAADIRP